MAKEYDLRGDKCCCTTGDGFLGIKYHLKSGDDFTVTECYQYNIECDFIMDSGSTFTADSGSQLIIEDGLLILDGCLVLNGCLKFK